MLSNEQMNEWMNDVCHRWHGIFSMDRQILFSCITLIDAPNAVFHRHLWRFDDRTNEQTPIQPSHTFRYRTRTANSNAVRRVRPKKRTIQNCIYSLNVQTYVDSIISLLLRTLDEFCRFSLCIALPIYQSFKPYPIDSYLARLLAVQ